MTDPGLDVATALASAVGALTLGTNCFASKVRPPGDGIPSKCVFCWASGGPAPDAYIDGGGGANHYYPQVRIRVRSDVNDFSGGVTFSQTIRDAAHELDVSGYYDARIQESEPIYIGEDDEGHHEWSMTLELNRKA